MPRTPDLPGVTGKGVAPKRIKAVEDAAELYVKIRDRRMALTDKEIDAKQNLVDTLHANAESIGVDDEGILRYRYAGDDEEMEVILRPGKEELKVRKAANPAGEEE